MSNFDIAFFIKPTVIGNSEGLIVLLSDLIKGLSVLGVRVRIFLSRRHEEALTSALNANGVERSAYEIVSFEVAPFLVKFHYRRRTALLSVPAVPAYGTATAKKLVFNIVTRLGVVGAVVLILLVFPLLLALLIPTATVVAAGIVMTLAFRKLRKWLPPRIRAVVPSKYYGSLRRIISSVLNSWGDLVDAATDVEAHRLGSRINGLRDIDAIFLPFAFSGALARRVSARKVLVFPDAVVLKYPTKFSNERLLRVVEGMSESIRAADSVICYSEYTRDEHLQVFFPDVAKEKDLHVIPFGFYHPNGAQSLSVPKLRFDNHFQEICSFVPDYDFREINYVVYPSVDRPHKNALTLIKAVHQLTRKRYLNLKFVSTTHSLNEGTRDFLLRERFFLDALFPSNLSESDLHYVIQHAKVVVHPSLSEGGDIFNFSRAVSQGTPALLSDIPMTREMFERQGILASMYEKWLFDPYDYLKLADLIEDTIANRQAVYQEQLAVLKAVERYDVREMARRYYDVYCSQLSKKATV